MSAPLEAEAQRELVDVVGAPGLVTDRGLLAGVERDWTGRWVGEASALVRPASTEEVAGVVAWARRHQVALVPQGGNTGLVGGSVPLAGEVVVSATRLPGVLDADGTAGQLTARAGTTIAEVQEAAEGIGWRYGVDLASRGSATVGGTIATNAGGVRVLRHGPTRAQVIGLEAVLGTGGVVSRLGGLTKDNTGYDLTGLMCGSEGTLGIVTAARLALVPRPPEIVTALVGYCSISEAVHAGQALRGAVGSLEAVELFTDRGLDLVCAHLGIRPPFTTSPRAYLLVEAADDRSPLDPLEVGLRSVGPTEEVAVAERTSDRQRLWRYREAITESVNARGVPHKFDVTLPPRALAAFIEEAPTIVGGLRPGAETWCFGHVVDGNVHVNVVGVDESDDDLDDLVLGEVIARGGSISAEHGIGIAKRRWLVADRGKPTVDAFRAIKAALDPDGICNPRVLL